MIYKKFELSFLIVIVLFTIFSCKKDPVWKVTIDSPFQFNAVIDGSIVSFNRYEGWGTERHVDSINGIVKTTYSAAVDDSTISGIEIDKGTLQLPEDSFSTCSEMQQFMLNGFNIYSDSAVNGIQVTYTDKGGNKWSTSLGSRKQLNGSFVILDSKMEDLSIAKGGLSVCCLKSLIKFNCTLYDKSGRSIELTDGLFLGDFPDYKYL